MQSTITIHAPRRKWRFRPHSRLEMVCFVRAYLQYLRVHQLSKHPPAVHHTIPMNKNMWLKTIGENLGSSMLPVRTTVKNNCFNRICVVASASQTVRAQILRYLFHNSTQNSISSPLITPPRVWPLSGHFPIPLSHSEIKFEHQVPDHPQQQDLHFLAQKQTTQQPRWAAIHHVHPGTDHFSWFAACMQANIQMKSEAFCDVSGGTGS